jgi:hypothetical protein
VRVYRDGAFWKAFEYQTSKREIAAAYGERSTDL